MFCGIAAIVACIVGIIQTLRISDRDSTIACLRNGEANLLWQRDNYYQKLQDMTASRDCNATMYEDACEEIATLNQEVQRLREYDQKANTLALKLNREIIDLKQQNRKLISRQKPNGIAYLKSGMCDIARFIASNQWMMEENKSLAEAVASVGEVAADITERED